MRRVIGLLISLCLTQMAHADVPWQYHGIRLGARMTAQSIMKHLGVVKYTKNPTFDVWRNSKGCAKNPNQKVCKEADFYKYGLAAVEYEEFQIGPFCEDKGPGAFYCFNPWMENSIPDWLDEGHGVVSMYVSVRDGIVHAIDINFDSANADDFFAVARRQLGERGWIVESGKITISECTDPTKTATFDTTTERKQTKLYSAAMRDYDQIYTHAGGPPYQGVLEMKMLDQTL